MHFSNSKLVLSPTDLSGFSECEHKTALDLAVAEGKLERPGRSQLEHLLLDRRGREHEQRVLEHYRAAGRAITTIPLTPGSKPTELRSAAEATLSALSAGSDVVYQGVFYDGAWLGRPDFLVKVNGSSRFGDHAYEVVDAKLARHEKAAAVLQLCAYSEQLARTQGSDPRNFWIATGRDEGRPTPLLARDYLAYYRRMKARLEGFVATDARPLAYPEPVEHCDVCQWWKRCADRRRDDDHLSLVAGISGRQRDRLGLVGVARVEELAKLAPNSRVEGLTSEGFLRIREQAALQVAGRGLASPLYELLLDADPGAGLERLPMPKPGDLFLDLEGDPFVGGVGLEYLFGLLELGEPATDFDVREAPGEPRYRAFWATNPSEEKRAFEALIDRIMLGLEEFRDLHVFHFGKRESEALKRLACRHNTREDALDELLRRHVFVDLHRVVKQAVRVSVEAYTLKELEALYGFRRQVERRQAARALHLFGFLLETGETQTSTEELCATIARYNEDDCRSTFELRGWLEARRPELEQKLERALTRPLAEAGSTSEKREEMNEETARLVKQLSSELPADAALDDERQRARRLLASLLDWHYREAKSGWWEYFRTLELGRDERVDDRAVLGELDFDQDLGQVQRSRRHRFSFPEQEHRIRAGDRVLDPDTQRTAGEVLEIGGGHVELKRNPQNPLPRALISEGPPKTDDQRACLLELGRSLVERGLDDRSQFGLARELLLRRAPACGKPAGTPLLPPGVTSVEALSELVRSLNGGVLAIQGPPGSGKTYRAAHMIAALIRAGKRVGVTANSHKVITSLIERAVEAGRETGLSIRAVHNPGSDKNERTSFETFELSSNHQRNQERLASGEIELLGGTAWAWSRTGFRDSVDVLVVDEASQVSLANVLSISLAAKNLVLLGDPAQLDQPQKGVHPPGADVSALEHLLGEAQTLPDDRGVFLSETRRLHPDICAFTSEVFYEGRLQPIPGLERQRLLGPEPFAGSGLRFLQVLHRGNSNRSDEECAAIEALLRKLLESESRVVNEAGVERALTPKDVLVVAPYNAQVAALRRALPPDVAVGTVDRFQGQEAALVIYSMTSSSAEDAPRGMEFLFSMNRLNVATSRARALVLLVASPELVSARCKTPRQMRLANALCTYIERARVADI